MRSVSSLLLIAMLAAGCGAKGRLDRTVDGLVAALQHGDRAALDSLLDPEFASMATEEKLADASAILRELGSFDGRTMLSISVQSDDSTGAEYVLNFGKGPVKLELTSKNGLLTAYEFSGVAVKEAAWRVDARKFAEFKVYSAKILNLDGTENVSGVLKPGDTAAFELVVQGFVERDDTYSIRVLHHLVDAEGADKGLTEVIRERDFPIQEGEHPVIFNTIRFQALIPGTHRVTFTVQDLHAGKQVKQAFFYTVEGA